MDSRFTPVEETGTVYLIHFERSYFGQSHYVGWAPDLELRLQKHREGKGSRLLALLHKANIGWELSRTWPDSTPADEARLKSYKKSKSLCPICNPPTAGA